MPDTTAKTPVIVMAYANERTEDGFLRELTTEMKEVMNALEPAVQKGRVHLKLIPAATQEEIAAVFQDEWYQERIWIFHYSGHADGDELWLEDENGGNKSFFSLGLARFLGVQKGLKLVFLNGCATKMHTPLLLEKNIPAVITTSEKIKDDMARDFARHFYRGMASGANIEESFGEAEGLILAAVGNNHFSASATRSLFWEEDTEAAKLDLPWKISFKEGASWFPAQWRLFHELKEADNAEDFLAEALIGQTIGNYEILELLGTGSMGSVYKVLHKNFNEERAMKITHRVVEGYDLLKDVVFAGNKGLSSINHPNVVKS
ncbi:MAG: CHAT domain-containing protein, partial [Bacteroidota bacterium]